MTIFDIITYIIITWVLSDMALFVAELLFDWGKGIKSSGWKLLLSAVAYILSCPKCFSFWFSLVLGSSLIGACLVALSINILKEIEYKIKRGVTKL